MSLLFLPTKTVPPPCAQGISHNLYRIWRQSDTWCKCTTNFSEKHEIKLFSCAIIKNKFDKNQVRMVLTEHKNTKAQRSAHREEYFVSPCLCVPFYRKFLTSICGGSGPCDGRDWRLAAEGREVLARRSRGVGQKDVCRRAEGCVCFEAGFCTFYAMRRAGLILSLLPFVLWRLATAWLLPQIRFEGFFGVCRHEVPAEGKNPVRRGPVARFPDKRTRVQWAVRRDSRRFMFSRNGFLAKPFLQLCILGFQLLDPLKKSLALFYPIVIILNFHTRMRPFWFLYSSCIELLSVEIIKQI